MILKLNTYVSIDFEGDPNLIPLLKRGLEGYVHETIEEMLEDGNGSPYYSIFPDELPREALGEIAAKPIEIRVLSLPEVQLTQQRLIRDRQNALNKEKQKGSTTKKSKTKSVVTRKTRTKK